MIILQEQSNMLINLNFKYIMIKITLPKELTLKTSPFFEQILQASSRGDVLIWNNDYTKATLTLSTDAFFSDEDAKAIIAKGGEVEGYPYWIKVKKTDFETTQIPVVLYNFLNNEQQSDINTQSLELPTYKDVFTYVRPVLEENSCGDMVETEYLEYLNSTNYEYLPMSITTKII